jgi:hypothetical protein
LQSPVGYFLLVRRCELGGADAQQLAEIGRPVERVGDRPLVSERRGGQQLSAELRHEHRPLQRRGTVQRSEAEESSLIFGLRVAHADGGPVRLNTRRRAG